MRAVHGEVRLFFAGLGMDAVGKDGWSLQCLLLQLSVVDSVGNNNYIILTISCITYKNLYL